MFHMNELVNLSRKELQTLAKENNIKANQKSSSIIEELTCLVKQHDIAKCFQENGHEEVPKFETKSSNCSDNQGEYVVGEIIELPCQEDKSNIIKAKIKRINKKSVRIILENKEISVPFDIIRKIQHDSNEINLKTEISGSKTKFLSSENYEIIFDNQDIESISKFVSIPEMMSPITNCHENNEVSI